MGWWVYLSNPETGASVPVNRHQEGGTYNLFGEDTAELSVTYNYGPHFRTAFDGLGFKEALDGKLAADVIPLLEVGVSKLGDEPDPDYWAATPGNAGHALAVLLGWARQHPEGIFRIS